MPSAKRCGSERHPSPSSAWHRATSVACCLLYRQPLILSASTAANLREHTPRIRLRLPSRLRPSFGSGMELVGTWPRRNWPRGGSKRYLRRKKLHWQQRVPKPRLIAPRESLLSPDYRNQLSRALLGTAGVAGLVLLLGCTNLIAAMLARSEARRREAAMRPGLRCGSVAAPPVSGCRVSDPGRAQRRWRLTRERADRGLAPARAHQPLCVADGWRQEVRTSSGSRTARPSRSHWPPASARVACVGWCRPCGS